MHNNQPENTYTFQGMRFIPSYRDNEHLQDQLQYLEEEIMSRGGYETMGQNLRNKYAAEIDLVLEEIALRN